MNNKKLLKQRPNVKDYDLQPYGYISDLTKYINKLEQALTIPVVSGSAPKDESTIPDLDVSTYIDLP